MFTRWLFLMSGQLIYTCKQNIMKTKRIIIYFNIIRLFLWISENVSICCSKFTSILRSTTNKHKSPSRSSVIEFLTVFDQFHFWKCAFARRRRYWNGYCIWITATNIRKGYVNGCNSWYKLFIVANDLFCNTGFRTTNSLNKTSRSKFKWSANGFNESKF